ncbi:MAG: MFS transporter [Acidobacteria bacterium]|nr:MFS transporter [Acidobacteriota bacterium]MBV9478416.1 MFS transporter [Acidobacteriota bacterium]
MSAPARSRWLLPTLASILYFSQGLPFGVVTETLNLYLAAVHAPLAQVGLLSSVGLAWTLKLFWAPAVDLAGTYRAWICGALVVITASLATLGFVTPATTPFWIVAAVLALASATQDIAIDALTIRITPPEQLGIVNSARVTSYRVAIILAGGGIAVLADRIGWRHAFLVSAILPLLIIVALLTALPREAGRADAHANPLRALVAWLQRPGSLPLLAVVLLYRLGDSALSPMIKPYWIARGFTATEVGNVTTTLGMICTIAGAIAGGAFVARFGIFAGLFWLGLVQMLSNLGYAFVATTGAGRSALYGAAVIETFCGGLGIAAFLSFLMFVCDKENAATEFAMLSAVFGFTRTLAGSVSGFFAQDLGYARYYWLTAALALPGLALLPLIRERVRGTATVVTDA